MAEDEKPTPPEGNKWSNLQGDSRVKNMEFIVRTVAQRLRESSDERNKHFDELVQIARREGAKILDQVPADVAARVISKLELTPRGGIRLQLTAEDRQKIWAWVRLVVGGALAGGVVELLHRFFPEATK